MITQLREENSLQRNSISQILQKLKSAQTELATYSKSYEQLQEKDAALSRMLEKEREMQLLLDEKEEEIEDLTRANRDAKNKY